MSTDSPSQRQSDVVQDTVRRGTGRSLVDVFTTTAATFPDRVALDVDGDRLAYVELLGSVRRFAEELEARGIGPGDRVGVQVESGTADLYIAVLGVLFAGACYVPVDAEDPPSRAEHIWDAAGVCAVVGDGLSVTHLTEPLAAQASLTVDDDAWVIFTSGSTGTPKGVAVAHRAAAAFVDAEAELLPVTECDRVLAGLSVSFDASCEEMWLAWRSGAALVPAPRATVRSGAEFGRWLAEHEISVVSTVPTLAAMWPTDALDGVRLLILGGERCPDELGWRLARRCEVWNSYGPTEATVVSTASRVVPGEAVTIGWPLPGWDVAVVDDAGSPVPVGEEGELVIAGVGLGRYLDAKLDKERFAPLPALGWRRAYRSGDVVRETPAGLAFVGRRDGQVKIAGRRVELGEIDAHVQSLAGVAASATVVRTAAGGSDVLVSYITGVVDAPSVRRQLADRLPGSLVPRVVVLDALPLNASGKVDARALPWPAGDGGDGDGGALDGVAAWLAERWAEELGEQRLDGDSDFFALGGTSVAAAKVVSSLRERYPSVGVADVYEHPRLRDLAARLDALSPAAEHVAHVARPSLAWTLGQLAGVLVVLAQRAPTLVIGVLAYNDLTHVRFGPQVSWIWLGLAWVVLASPPSRAGMVMLARRLLLTDLAPGRYPRHGWLAWRLWFVERLSDISPVDNLAGTPWAPAYARLFGVHVGDNVHLATLPPVTGLVSIGAGATIETGVDLHGWWVDGGDLEVGRIDIGPGARIGARSVLMPGACVGEGADVEAGAVVTGSVPPGERWEGSPARPAAGQQQWPPRPARRPSRRWRAMYGLGLAGETILPLLAMAPGLVLVDRWAPSSSAPATWGWEVVRLAPALAALFILCEVAVIAVCYRAAARWLKPGWHPEGGAVSWAGWFTESLVARSFSTLFPLYGSVYARPFLGLLGVRLGVGAEVSHSASINPLVTFGDISFAADDVSFLTAKGGNGWVHVRPIAVGGGSFLGNSAVVPGGGEVGDRALVGVLSTAPSNVPDDTSWFGAPAIELARVPTDADPARTTNPPRSLVLARAAVELVRILLPTSMSIALLTAVWVVLDATGRAAGFPAMAALAPIVLVGAGLVATSATVAAKWALMGRYRPGRHLFWSAFVWRDEIINSCQEQLAAGWLLSSALATPIMTWYLRAMGADVGRNVWFETLAITEFDVVALGDDVVVNRTAVVETHLVHDRVLRIGPTQLGPGATLGP
ncbi:MAG: amino acid adenylation domain-containing protein, partial [Acidimicrobiia bacterium]|nr:amino acid adenylation domain-containing protein [Acidimicrobiia bacterium]